MDPEICFQPKNSELKISTIKFISIQIHGSETSQATWPTVVHGPKGRAIKSHFGGKKTYFNIG
jgi:hypothetical protein